MELKMNIALLLAGGSGTRTEQDVPKQFFNVYEKPIIIYTLRSAYVANVRNNLKGQLNNISIVEKDGTITNLGEKHGKNDC